MDGESETVLPVRNHGEVGEDPLDGLVRESIVALRDRQGSNSAGTGASHPEQGAAAFYHQRPSYHKLE